jgi:hypothetical protein
MEPNMVQATFRYPDGPRIEAILLSKNTYSMRLVPRGAADTLELRLNYGQWHDEDGAPVEIEWLISEGHAAEVFSQPVAARALAALPRQVAE